jgi:iron complex outermembrane receptor protein
MNFQALKKNGVTMVSRTTAVTTALFACTSISLFAQDTLTTARALKKLSLEELMNIEVVSVSRGPQKLTEAASAIQVITNEDIRRSGATRLPEALRLASNLIVAQSNSHDWGITARGFNGAPLANNTSANKLLVMIDGRTVYSPLFGGVFWDVQNVLLEDIERIEVVSGPGGTLWDANAVNGVINIITRNAKDTEGLFATVGVGSFLRNHAALRYGIAVNDKLFLRLYGQRYDQERTIPTDGNERDIDEWDMNQGGFRMDFEPNSKNRFIFQGDFYDGSETTDNGDQVDGQNLMVRWTKSVSETSGFDAQLYYDRTWRYLPGADFGEELHTYDGDFQHRFAAGDKNNLLWGIGFRVMQDIINNSPALSFDPRKRNMDFLSAFIQDQIILVPRHLQLTLGSKILHNVYSGWELQPSGRMAWTPDDRNTIWMAVSRSVRTPTRWDADEVTPIIVTPGNRFLSEKVRTYELGYRLEPIKKVSFSLATYFNFYKDLRSINQNPNSPPGLIFANDQRAESTGVEVSGNYFASSSWRVRGGYSYLRTTVWSTKDTVMPYSAAFEAIDPKSQFVFQSILDVSKSLDLDVTGRYVHRLDQTAFTPQVPSYFTFDARLAWQIQKFTLALIGQNLLEKNHLEFGSRRIPRSYYAKLTCRL